jgi:hypothetical protein
MTMVMTVETNVHGFGTKHGTQNVKLGKLQLVQRIAPKGMNKLVSAKTLLPLQTVRVTLKQKK